MADKLFGNSDKAVSLEDLEGSQTEVSDQELQTGVQDEQQSQPADKGQKPQESSPSDEEAQSIQDNKEPIEQPSTEPKSTEAKEGVETQEPVNDPGNPKPTLDITVLNKQLGREFDSFDSLSKELERASKVDELEGRVKDYESTKQTEQELREKYDILLERSDPKKFFANEESLKLEQFKKQNPDKDPSIAQNIFATQDLDQVDDFEIVKWGEKLDHPRLKSSDDSLRGRLAKRFGEDPDVDMSEWSQSAQDQLLIEADKYRKSFREMKNVEVPEMIDVESIRQQRLQEKQEKEEKVKQDWTSKSKEIKDSVSKLKLEVGSPKEGESQEYFEWDISPEQSSMVDGIIDQMVSSGMEMNEDNLNTAKEAAFDLMLRQELPNILSKYKETVVSELESKHLKDTHNPEPLHDTQAPQDDQERAKKEFQEWAKRPTTGFSRNPLFHSK